MDQAILPIALGILKVVAPRKSQERLSSIARQICDVTR